MAAAELQKIKSESLGKNSELTNLLKSMRDIPAEERPRFGQMVNEARKLIEEAFADAERKMKEKTLRDKLEKERVDITLPCDNAVQGRGHLHPITLVARRNNGYIQGAWV